MYAGGLNWLRPEQQRPEQKRKQQPSRRQKAETVWHRPRTLMVVEGRNP